jgi:hypothetical protein
VQRGRKRANTRSKAFGHMCASLVIFLEHNIRNMRIIHADPLSRRGTRVLGGRTSRLSCLKRGKHLNTHITGAKPLMGPIQI